MAEQKTLDQFENKIGVKFNNKKLLRQAFIHRSYLNENVGLDLDHNERLEFLGDAVLELIVTEYLYQKYKNPEGELTNWRAALVKRPTLASVAKDLSIGDYLFLSKGEQKTGGKSRELILANTFEALLGALYLDQGFTTSTAFVKKHLLSKLKNVLDKKLYIDPKSRLQEMAQESVNVTPIYKVLAEYGPDHSKSFTVGVYVKDKLIGQGSGSSKQSAEQSAATSALENWKE